MGIRLYKEPKLEKPDLIVSWPGIGNIGIIAVDTLRGLVKAEELGEIEPGEFFDPRKVSIKAGLLKDLEFPTSKFYFQRIKNRDVLFFIGEQQPTEGEEFYARGGKAYQMANLVLDVGLKFGCRRVYTSGACVSLIHHQMKPRVCAVVSCDKLISEVKEYQNTVLMSELGGRDGEGIITGLNGLLLAVAKKRGLESICLMGEIPDWLSGAPLSYPKASKSVAEVFADILGIRIDLSVLDNMAIQTEDIIEKIYEKFPPEIKERYEQRKPVPQAKPEAITDEDAKWIREHMDEFFKRRDKEDG
jgi:proteasome assembly chaperone (PAC2) family protein